jgi:hypothetical protein
MKSWLISDHLVLVFFVLLSAQADGLRFLAHLGCLRILHVLLDSHLESESEAGERLKVCGKALNNFKRLILIIRANSSIDFPGDARVRDVLEWIWWRRLVTNHLADGCSPNPFCCKQAADVLWGVFVAVALHCGRIVLQTLATDLDYPVVAVANCTSNNRLGVPVDTHQIRNVIKRSNDHGADFVEELAIFLVIEVEDVIAICLCCASWHINFELGIPDCANKLTTTSAGPPP